MLDFFVFFFFFYNHTHSNIDVYNNIILVYSVLHILFWLCTYMMLWGHVSYPLFFSRPHHNIMWDIHTVRIIVYCTQPLSYYINPVSSIMLTTMTLITNNTTCVITSIKRAANQTHNIILYYHHSTHFYYVIIIFYSLIDAEQWNTAVSIMIIR